MSVQTSLFILLGLTVLSVCMIAGVFIGEKISKSKPIDKSVVYMSVFGIAGVLIGIPLAIISEIAVIQLLNL
ncbi:hypothetical protein [Sporosarcina sp. FSL W7-1283]|uniref:hypothetical protein n=1 Tax=Sporosarcina sp. FSL W7-1283 TaxID=2921560 RepID=UPI0030F6ED8F